MTHVVMDSLVLEEPSSSTTCSRGCSGSGSGGSRAIDRHNPIIRDEKRLGQGRIFPSTPTIATTTIITDQLHHCHQKTEVGVGDQKQKSVAFAHDEELVKASEFTSPTSSSRCLLNNNIAKSYFTSEIHHVLPPPSPPREHVTFHNGNDVKKKDDDLVSSPPSTPPQPPSPSLPLPCDGLKQLRPHSSAIAKPPSPPHPPPSSHQVVVLEVALHCRGCERKMKKHISKMEGVTSFKIEFAAKKVAVVGDVTPLAVLTNVLKVKNAKLLAPATLSSG